jgi:hypothetical protein
MGLVLSEHKPQPHRSLEDHLGRSLAELLVQAKQHKRLSAQHRRMARDAMEKVRLIQDDLERLGIRIAINEGEAEDQHGPASNNQI